MLLNNKNYIKEKFKIKSLKTSNISLIDEKYKNANVCEEDEEELDIYTTSNIVADKIMTSENDYCGLPSMSTISNLDINNNTKINNTKINNDYTYHVFNQDIPSTNLERKIMIYTINTTREIPFLLYLLRHDRKENEYKLLDFNINNITNTNNISLDSIQFKEENINAKYSGFLTYKNVNYLFFRSYEPNIMNSKEYIWSTISEIINFKQIYNVKIDDKIADLFLNNNYLLNIKKTNGIIYETPTVGYSAKNEFDGLIYFNDFNDALEKSDDKYINRYAIFLGFMKLNNKSNKIFYFLNTDKYYKTTKCNSVYDVINSDYSIDYFLEINDKNRYVLLSRFEKQ